jgi:transcriptional regulator with GAF, ATPase, and Fis domain
MKSLILDETLDVSSRLQSRLLGRGCKVQSVCSLQELELTANLQEPPKLIIVNLTGDLTAWQISRYFQARPVTRAGLILVDRDPVPGLDTLTALPGIDCVERDDTARIEAWLDRVTGRLAALSSPPSPAHVVTADAYCGIIGQSQQLREVLAKIDKVAGGDANVCIMGESGTGKELIARAIHQSSPRRNRPLVTLDCTAIPEGLMESQLFGHRRGSFTGAVEHRNGVFALAHTGTLFIDEISELPLPLQAKLLRVIQAHEFVKVGGSKPIRTDIRLITASNKDLREAVADGTFRADLYYRIAVVMIQLPPLRERRDDIPRLVEHFLEKFSTVHRKPIPALTPQALELLTSYNWPGNVRQLENCIEQALVLADDQTIDVDVLSLDEHEPKKVATGPTPAASIGLTLREVEQEHILRTLRAVDGSRTRAAKILGISLRCLQYKLKSYAEEGTDHLEPAAGVQTNYSLGVQ